MNIRVIKADVERCPQHSLLAAHYNDDGSCKCLGYIALYRSQRWKLYADSSYDAWKKAVGHFRPPKSRQHLVTVHLAEKGGETVTQVITS